MSVSVIIPCYNVQDFINECLDSVYKQTYPDIEIICVDNNSSDGTFRILEKHEVEGKIKLYKELKKGAPSARNLGLKHAKGEWIQFLDADDLLLPTKIDHQMSLCKTDSDAAIIAASYTSRNIDGTEEMIYPLIDTYFGLLRSELGITSSNLFKRTKLLDIGGWNEVINSSQEYDLMFRMIKMETVVIFDDQLNTIIRKRTQGQISQMHPSNKWIQYVELRLDIIDYLKFYKKEFYSKNQCFIDQILFDLLRTLARYELNIANKILKERLKNFLPQESARTSNKYLKLYAFLGFYKTEKLLKWIN